MDNSVGSALINDVLDLSKIEAGKMELESVSYNIRKEVDGVFFLFDEKLQQKKLEVSMLVHEAVPTCVVGDPGRFRQVLVLTNHNVTGLQPVVELNIWIVCLILLFCFISLYTSYSKHIITLTQLLTHHQELMHAN